MGALSEIFFRSNFPAVWIRGASPSAAAVYGENADFKNWAEMFGVDPKNVPTPGAGGFPTTGGKKEEEKEKRDLVCLRR